MSDVEWDAEDFEPPTPTSAPVVTDKWAGEDEEVEVKESWEDDDKKDGSNQTSTTAPTAKKKKKKLAEILAEKEKKQLEEVERRHREKEEEKKDRTPEEILAEKLRIQKIQEDSDFKLAADILADKPEPTTTTLEAFDLNTGSGLSAFRIALTRKIRTIERLEKRTFYVSFLEDLCRGLCENLEMDDIKKVTSVLNALYNEKVKANKPSKGKKKAAVKAKLNVGTNAIADDVNTISTYDDYDYDDFI